jgi:hypothetical protein
MDGFGGSVRSPSGSSGKRRAPTWDGSPATDFAITTVNVPDRLDMQEVRAREEEDGYQRKRWFSIDRYSVTVWSKRLVLLGVVGGLGWLGWTAAQPVVNEFNKEQIAARLSKAAGVPVSIREQSYAVWPQPKLSLLGVDVGGQLKFEEIALQMSWQEIVAAARMGRFTVAEAVIGPTKLDIRQAGALVDLGPKLAGAAGFGISSVRFSSVEFPQFDLLPHRYEVLLRRSALPQPVVVRQLTGEGQMQLEISPAAGGEYGFQLEAQRWRAPIGPGVVWGNVSASGRVLPTAVVVDSYTAAGGMGAVQGALVAAADVDWSLAGTARSVNLDLESLMRYVGGGSPDEAAAARAPLLGTATMTLIGGGHGPSVGDALFSARMTGPVSVRWATLNGINLGLAATQGGAASTGGGAGGITRFTELSADAEVSGAGLALRNVNGRAGAMATRGQVNVAPDLQLSGGLRVDLGADRVQAPINVRVSGTAVAPRFGR